MKTKSTGPKRAQNMWGYLDETGSLGDASQPIFGIGMVVTPSPRLLHKRITQLKSGYKGEFKFSNVTRNKDFELYRKLIDAYFDSTFTRFSARIYLKANLETDISKYDQVYQAYNRIAARLIYSTLDKGAPGTSDYIAVIADDISTSIDDNFESEVKKYVRRRARRNALFGISRAESHAFTEIQVCDVLLGIVAYAFRLKLGLIEGKPNAHKVKLVKYLQTKLGVDSLSSSFVARPKNGQRFEVSDKTQEEK